MFRKILISNRGEIAVRVVRACRELGVRSVAIYSEADRDALHVRLADESVACGPARATESYLDGQRIVELARRVGADAVHPGYGFLSENAEFAEMLDAANIKFIGPAPGAIRSMALKVAARERMQKAGVAVVPGGREIDSVQAARTAAATLGYPILVKASAGGGGRGMRRVDDEGALEAALERAASEADSAFGDGALYLEKLLDRCRHIEIQLLADQHGNIVHLGERECSIQRRHQKLVEEAPAFGMTDALRSAMGAAAIRAAVEVDYEGAGTCEFLVDAKGDFYFLEMNTRIQVEHRVTEAVTGIDLVVWQIRIAAGDSLTFQQAEISLRGHAIETRIYAEDPEKGFMPSPGPILGWRAPSGVGIRLDSSVDGCGVVTTHYDPMIAKLIVSGRDRAEALARMAVALEEFWIAGIRTSLPFLRRLMGNAVFRGGRYDTGFVESEMSDAPGPLNTEIVQLIFALVACRAGQDVVNGSRHFGLSSRELGFTSTEVISASNSAVISTLENSCARVDEAIVRFEQSNTDAPILRLRRGETSIDVSIVRRKQGGFEVGLRDRVLRFTVDVESAS